MANLTRAKSRINKIFLGWFNDDPMMLGAWCLIEKRPDKKQKTMGIDSKSNPPVVKYNPNFVNALSMEQLESVMVGEGFKLLLRHPTSRLLTPKNISSLASSITVDQKIMGAPFDIEGIKESMPMPEMFGLPKELFFEEYFRKLKDMSDDTQDKIQEIWDSMSDEEKQDMMNQAQNGGGQSEGEGEDGEPQNGQGDGQSQDNKDSDGFENFDSSGSKSQTQGEALKEYWNPNGTANQDWGENTLMDANIENFVNDRKSSGEQWGKYTSDFQVDIIAANEPKISWKEMVRRFNTSVISGHNVTSRKKVNRRYDLDSPGRRRVYKSKIIFAIDVSGSMSDDDVAEGFAVINSVCRHAEIDYVLFDTEIKDVQKKMRKAKQTFKVTGRGGTDFTEVVQYANDNKADGLIIFTDGDAGSVSKPKYSKVLWLMHSKDQKPPVDWGFIAHLDRYESRY